MEGPPSPLSATTTQSSLIRRNLPHLQGQNLPHLLPAALKLEMKQKKFWTLSYLPESGRKMESCGDNPSPQPQQPGEQIESNDLVDHHLQAGCDEPAGAAGLEAAAASSQGDRNMSGMVKFCF